MHKFRSLDGLRGLAALTVVFCHYVNGFFPALAGLSPEHHSRFEGLAANFPFTLLYNGNFAVCIFFVLSGFVLSQKFFQTKSNDVIIAGALKRYPRLMIPALGSAILAYLLLAGHFFKNVSTADLTGSAQWLAAFWNFPASFGQALYEGGYGAFFAGQNSYNTNLWTMQYELFGSFLVFMILLLFGRLSARWLIYLMLCLAFYNTYYLAFIVGVILSDLWVNRPQWWSQFEGKTGWLAVVLGLILGGWPNASIPGTLFYPLTTLNADALHLPLSVFAHIIGATLIVIGAVALKPVRWVLELRPAQYLGRISFSMYLLHLLVIGSYSSYLFTHLPKQLPYSVSFVIMLMASLIILFIASSLYEKWVDRPAIAVSSRLSSWFMHGRVKVKARTEQPVAPTMGVGPEITAT